MSPSSPFLRRSRTERLAAWLVTGPLGHLVAFTVDVAVAWSAWARAAIAEAVVRSQSSKR